MTIVVDNKCDIWPILMKVAHNFPYVELETRATEADKGPFLAILEGGLLMIMVLFTFSLK